MKSNLLFNDFRAQWEDIRSPAIAAVERVGTSGWLILGEEVAAFESSLAAKLGFPYAIGCGSGLDAIELSLRALNLKQGDLVMTTPLSAFATTLAILRAGGVPVFVDVDESGLVDLEKARACLATQPIRFFVPVHLFGHSLEASKLAGLKNEYGFKLVEDCAQAIGATSAGVPVGQTSELATLSFYPTKNLGCMGDGGAVLTHTETYSTCVRTLRDYGQKEKYVHIALGMNSRLDELQAAIMRDALLPRLDIFTGRRRVIAAAYLKSISHPRITIPTAPRDSLSVYHLFPILVDGDRDRLRQHLAAEGIMTAIHYPVAIPDQPVLRNYPFLLSGEIARARHFARHELSLPIHPYLSDLDVERVITACNSWPT